MADVRRLARKEAARWHRYQHVDGAAYAAEGAQGHRVRPEPRRVDGGVAIGQAHQKVGPRGPDEKHTIVMGLLLQEFTDALDGLHNFHQKVNSGLHGGSETL